MTATARRTIDVPTKAAILRLLDTDAYAVEKAIVTIYERQTADEQNADTTVHANGVGFSAYDAQFLSSLARHIITNRRPKGDRLSPRQLEAGRKAIKRYAGQLLDVAMDKYRRLLAAGHATTPMTAAEAGDPYGLMSEQARLRINQDRLDAEREITRAANRAYDCEQAAAESDEEARAEMEWADSRYFGGR